MFKLNAKQFILRSLMIVVGMVLLGFGSALSMQMGMGLDPFTAFNTGIATLFNISLGAVSMIINALITVFIFIFKRSRIGLGTIYTIFFIGYIIEYFIVFLDRTLDPSDFHIVLRIVITIIAIAIFTFGVSMIMDANLGISPYDAVTPMIVDYTPWHFIPVRISQDALVILIAILLDGPVGIATFITGFLAGPFIEFFSIRVTQKIARKIG